MNKKTFEKTINRIDEILKFLREKNRQIPSQFNYLTAEIIFSNPEDETKSIALCNCINYFFNRKELLEKHYDLFDDNFLSWIFVPGFISTDQLREEEKIIEITLNRFDISWIKIETHHGMNITGELDDGSPSLHAQEKIKQVWGEKFGKIIIERIKNRREK